MKKLWRKVRKFFHDSEVLALSFMHGVVGAVGSVLTYFDWNRLISMVQGATPKQIVMAVSGLMVAQGVIFWVARKNRATDL